MTDQNKTPKDEAAQEAAPIHKSIAAAIAAAVREVRVIGKSDRNKFDGYDFAGIDKFLTLVNPICGRNGLFPIVSQREVEFYENVNSKGGKSVWARFFYDVTMHHESGETLGPVNMMVAVPMNGAQSSGSAQSYALKQFFRAMLMIPTGDKDDADLNATEQHQAPKFDAAAATKRIKGKLALSETLDDLKERWTQERDTIAEVKAASADMFAEIEAAKNKRRDAIQAVADTMSDDLDGDAIPYEGAN
jgi:hypothetical protein